MNTNTPLALRIPNSNVFFNSVPHLIFAILRNNIYTSPFNSGTEDTLLKCISETKHNACNSKDLDALKFQLVHHDTFYNGQIQQDSIECLLMLIDIIIKGSIPDSSYPHNPIKLLIPRGLLYLISIFSVVLENMLSVMYADCGPPYLSLVVCYILHLYLFHARLDFTRNATNVQKSCSRCNKNTWHVESNFFVNRFRYTNDYVTDRCSIPTDTTVMLGPHKKTKIT